MEIKRRLIVIISLILSWLILMPIFVREYSEIPMKDLNEIISTLPFLFLLPLGFINLFVNVNDTNLPGYLGVIILMLGIAIYGNVFTCYLWKCERFSKERYIIFYFIILLIFVLSMKGCVKMTLDPHFICIPGLF